MQLRLAMVGGGHAAQSLHLPAAALSSKVHTAVVADPDIERAEELAEAYGVEHAVSDDREVPGLADIAVVAAPHHLHFPIARRLLEAGVHVLAEKPLALTAGECDELTRLARERGLVLAVAMVRRAFPAARFVKEALATDLLGDIWRVSVEEGSPFAWKVRSDFTFRRDAGGGVLADLGVHLLDLLGWWLGDLEVAAYRDDDSGGVEADCEIELRLANGAPVDVELSRTRALANSVLIEGTRGTLRSGTGFDAEVTLDLGASELTGKALSGGTEHRNVRELFIDQFDQFADAVLEGRVPPVTGEEAAATIATIERCKQVRQPLDLPWLKLGAGLEDLVTDDMQRARVG